MKPNLKSPAAARFMLLAAAIIWGTSFFILKNATDVFPPLMLIAARFTLSALVLGAIFWKHLKSITPRSLLHGAVIGACLVLAYDVQTIGLTTISPGSNAFLTASYCVWVPFMYWLVMGARPRSTSFVAALMMVGGVALVSFTGDFKIGRGELITLASGVLYAIHIVLVERLGRNDDPMALTITQFACGAVPGWIIAFTLGELPTAFPLEALGALAYLSVMCTAVAMLFQILGQRGAPASSASILLSLEAVFGLAFSMLFYGERVTPRAGCGFALIFAAVLVSEGVFSRRKREAAGSL